MDDEDDSWTGFVITRINGEAMCCSHFGFRPRADLIVDAPT